MKFACVLGTQSTASIWVAYTYDVPYFGVVVTDGKHSEAHYDPKTL